MQEHWIWYAERKASAQQKRMLLEHFGSAEAVYQAEEEALYRLPDMTNSLCEELLDKNLEDARKILGKCRKMHIHVLTYGDENYPPLLRNLHDAPVVLYYQGMLPCWEAQPAVGIVGTRKATPYGEEMAAALSGQIAQCGGLVVSGGALGIDTVALESAMATGNAVVAVLAGGLDRPYPASNIPLFHKICTNGCIFSEYPPGTPSMSWMFPQRNRIISGISSALLVVEAPARSGALISARHAMEQGRDVFTVPGNVSSPTCAGSNGLLQEGARAAMTGWDVMREYELLYPGRVRRREAPKPTQKSLRPVAQKATIPEIADKKGIDKKKKSTYSGEHIPKPALSEEEQALVAAVGAGGGLTDDIIARSGLNAAQAKKLLTRLALRKVLTLHPGGRVTLQ